MRYRVVIEYDSRTRSYTATVPGLPVFADADTEKEAVKLAKEGIAWYLEDAPARPRGKASAQPVKVKLVSVDL